MRQSILLILLLLAAAAARAESPAAMAGDYLEARSNHVYTCACLCNGESVTAGREAILAWEFRQGSLAGVRVAAVVVGQGHLSLGPAARRSVLYIDGAAPEQQRAALALFGRRYSEVLGPVTAVHTTPIAFERTAERARLSIGDAVRLDIRRARLPDDAHLGSYLWYGPFVPLAESSLGMTLEFRYGGSDLDRRWWEAESGITGYFGTFVLP
jgi:hypothetical protein